MTSSRLAALPGESSAAPADLASAITALLRDFSIEVTPRQAAKVDSFAALLPPGTRVFVTFVPGETVDAVLPVIDRLAREGMRPVPHIAARNLLAEATFQHYLRGAHACGAREVLVIAGGARRPAGPYASTMDLLNTGLFEELGFRRLYVAGHPEGSPDIPPAELARALAAKNAWSARRGVPLEIVTQFTFDGGRLTAWEREIRAAGNRLPVRAGLAGPASVTSLLKYARMCGVTASLGFLQRSGGRFLQLVGQAAPDGVITALARARMEDPDSRLHRVHFYPFGGFARTAAWARAVAAGRFTLFADGSGFAVES